MLHPKVTAKTNQAFAHKAELKFDSLVRAYYNSRSLIGHHAQLALARIAQSVEQGIENPRVGGSIPPPGTICFPLADDLSHSDRMLIFKR